jgi:class 3 adenylate cyclase
LHFCCDPPRLGEAMREPVERRLAAILAADVAGYTRLKGADDEGTLLELIAVECDVRSLRSFAGRSSRGAPNCA